MAADTWASRRTWRAVVAQPLSAAIVTIEIASDEINFAVIFILLVVCALMRHVVQPFSAIDMQESRDWFGTHQSSFLHKKYHSGNSTAYNCEQNPRKIHVLFEQFLLPRSLRQLAAVGTTRHFPKRTRFIAEGDVGTSVYIILAARVKIFTSDAGGKEFLFGTYDSGTILAEMALDGLPRSASVEALTDIQCAIAFSRERQELSGFVTGFRVAERRESIISIRHV